MKRAGRVEVKVGASVGSFEGQLVNRTYIVLLHVATAPQEVILKTSYGETTLNNLGSKSALEWEESGWFFDRTYSWGRPFSFYTFNEKPGRFSAGAGDCSELGCPPYSVWRHQTLAVKVRTDIRESFTVIANPSPDVAQMPQEEFSGRPPTTRCRASI